MIKSFNPGFTIIHPEYDQGPSGGFIIDIPTDPTITYLDPSTGIEYFFLTEEEGADQTGYYWYDENGNELFFGTTRGDNWQEIHP